MDQPIQKYLTNCKSLYICIYCRTHLANHDELISRSFQGSIGRAYLFNCVINITCGAPVDRVLMTGSHIVADIFCSNCENILGWKYERASEESQRYKEGKYVIELAHVIRENRHLELDRQELMLSGLAAGAGVARSSSGYGSRHSRPRASLNSQSNGMEWHNDSDSLSSPTSSSSPSTSPTSPRQWDSLSPPSQTDNSNDEDDELMFPIYDELSTTRSSYPNSISLCHLNRMRRSLYLDSTPYDWKFSTQYNDQSLLELDSSASTNKQTNRQSGDLTSGLTGALISTINSRACNDSQLLVGEQEEETQFELESDRTNPYFKSKNASVTAIASGSFSGHTISSIKVEDPSCSSSLECDDEEFYDCYTDHDVVNT